MFSLFSDFFACRDNPLSRIDPRAKLLIAITAILGVLLSKTVLFPILIFLLCLTAILALRIPLPLVGLRLGAPMGIVCILVLLQSFMTGSTPLWTIPAGPWKLVATLEGVHTGLLTAARVCGAVTVVLLLSFVTPAHRIFHSLRWFRVPQGWVEIAILMYRYTFTLLDLTADISAAQQLRLGYTGLKRALTSMGTVCGTVIIRSVDQAVHTHEAMILRGYRNEIPFGPLPPMPVRDGWIVAVAVPGLVLLSVVMGRIGY